MARGSNRNASWNAERVEQLVRHALKDPTQPHAGMRCGQAWENDVAVTDDEGKVSCPQCKAS